jgi:hypothetical protein
MSSVRIPRVPTYSGYCSLFLNFAYGIVTLFDLSFNTVRLSSPMLNAVLTPQVFLPAVWAPPISLATTFGIVFTFFSSGY